MRTFEAGEFLRLIEEWEVTVLLLVPSIYLMLSQFPDFDKYNLSSVRSWASGGSSLPPSLVEEYTEKEILIQQGFGMTETGPTVFIIGREDALRKAGSVGKPVLHTEIRILDEQGKVLGPNQVGELCIRGGNVISGYEKDECYFQNVDSLHLPLEWDGDDATSKAGQQVRLRFHLRNARVYAVTTDAG